PRSARGLKIVAHKKINRLMRQDHIATADSVSCAVKERGIEFGTDAIVSPQPAPHDTLSPTAQASKTSTASHAIRPPGPPKPLMQPAVPQAVRCCCSV